MGHAHDAVQHVCCSFCQARIRCPAQLQQFHCPRCGKKNEIIASSPQPRSAPAPNSNKNPLSNPAPAAAPVVETASSAASRLPAIVCWSVGGLIGVFSAVVLSALKPALGRSGLLIVVGLAIVATFALGAAFFAFRWCERSLQAETAQAFGRLRLRSGWALRVVGSAALLCTVAITAEWFGPEQGFFRRLTDGSITQRPDPKPLVESATIPTSPHVVAKPSFLRQDLRPWTNSDFVVVNPAHRAVGVRNRGDIARPEYDIVAKASEEEVVAVKRFAWENKIPIWAADPALARRLFDEFSPGQTVVGNRRDELAAAFQVKNIVPTGGAYIAYYDTVNRLKRVGHLFKDQSDSFVFADLLPQRVDAIRLKELGADAFPFRTEIIRRSERVQPGTEQRNLNDIGLRESADFVDYCLYGALTTLQNSQASATAERDRITPHLYVDCSVDVPADELASLKQEKSGSRDELRRELNHDFVRDHTPLGILNLLNRQLAERQRYAQRMNSHDNLRHQIEDELDELRQDIKKLQRLNQVESTLAAEIRRGLIRAGIKVVERSDRAKEILCNKVQGNRWVRADAKTAIETNLVDATHVLMTALRKAETPGTYLVSMRLISVFDGTILWEEVGTRDDRDPSTTTTSLKTTATPNSRGSSLRGVWTTAAGLELSFTETNNVVRAQLVSGEGLESFELAGTREGSTVTVSSCAVKIKRDPLRQIRPVRAEVTIIDANTIRIGCDAIQLDPRGREIGRTYQVLDFNRKAR